jgi:formylglycine-generating enzyme required for sulfatase activity
MVRVHTPTTSFCIDTTEVTNGGYEQFLAAVDGGAWPAMPKECSQKSNFSPREDIDGGLKELGNDAYPVVWVDWCDALAFCLWAGKRLCGAVGGGPATYPDVAGEWGVACSNNGAFKYPYGDTFKAGVCGDGTIVPREIHTVRSFPGCTGAADPRIFDLSGNVDEWENACEAQSGLTDYCTLRGGSVGDDGREPLYFACAAGYVPPLGRGYGKSDVGFRCCAD